MTDKALAPIEQKQVLFYDDEITAVLTYIKSTWPEDIQQTQWEATLREELQNK